MAKHKKKPKDSGSTIATNRKARFEFHLHERLEAGLALEGWEVKSLRAGRINFDESFVQIDKGEAWLHGARITPLPSASTHNPADPVRKRKLLLHKYEINRLIGVVERKGMTLVPTALYWKKGKIKLEIAVAEGKKLHDKRETAKNRDWQREKARVLKHG